MWVDEGGKTAALRQDLLRLLRLLRIARRRQLLLMAQAIFSSPLRLLALAWPMFRPPLLFLLLQAPLQDLVLAIIPSLFLLRRILLHTPLLQLPVGEKIRSLFILLSPRRKAVNLT